MTRKTILVDIDHTISAAWPRDAMIGGEGGWDAYHAASGADEPLDDIVALVNAMHSHGYKIVALTARPGKWRQLTMEWLIRNSIFVDDLLMRPDDDYRTSGPLKMDLALNHFGSLTAIAEQVAFLLEDHDEVITAFRALGITTLHVSGRQK